MTSRKWVGLMVGALSVMGGGCEKDYGILDPACEFDIDAHKSALERLARAAKDMRGRTATACAGIAGVDPAAEPSDADVSSVCDLASAAIDDAFSAASPVDLDILPPRCSIDAETQIDCERDCAQVAECACSTPVSVEDRCSPGDLSGICPGECVGTCGSESGEPIACDGSCSATCVGACDATCHGSCSGTCDVVEAEGTCAGACGGTCDGACEGRCQGTCSGSCEPQADVVVECSGVCSGTCSGEFERPSCGGPLEPASCTCEVADACIDGCGGLGPMGATCTEATVTLGGNVDEGFRERFETHFGDLLEVLGQAEIVAGSMGDVIIAAQAASDDLVERSEACRIAGEALAVDLEDAEMAARTVNTTVEAMTQPWAGGASPR